MSLPAQDNTHKELVEPKKTPLAQEISDKELAERGATSSEGDASFARAANEDDDGYDPWSDRREDPNFFEEDPWR